MRAHRHAMIYHAHAKRVRQEKGNIALIIHRFSSDTELLNLIGQDSLMANYTLAKKHCFPHRDITNNNNNGNNQTNNFWNNLMIWNRQNKMQKILQATPYTPEQLLTFLQDADFGDGLNSIRYQFVSRILNTQASCDENADYMVAAFTKRLDDFFVRLRNNGPG